MLKLKGNKIEGYIIDVSDKKYHWDIQLNQEELEKLYKELKRKFK